MKFRAAKPTRSAEFDVVVVPLFEDKALPEGLARATRAVVERIAQEGGATRLHSVHTHFGEKSGRIVTVGAGKRADYDAERARNVASAAIKSLWRSNARRVGIFVEPIASQAGRGAQATVEGVHFAMWRPEAHRTRPEERRLPKLDTVTLLVGGGAPRRVGRARRGDAVIQAGDLREAIRRGEAVGVAVNTARRLSNEPANKMTPTMAAEEARALASAAGIECEVLDRKRCEALGMHSYLSVAQGSHQPPQFVVLRYRGRGGRGYDLGFVGKGITFDSGGISLKDPDGMFHMKADMTGAASVIAAMAALGTLRPMTNVIGVAPLTENLPGGGATKPGDVFTSMSGKTVEVVNTDAEGRLVLIDGVTYVQREGAKRVVDVATLTGAMIVALGPVFTGLFGKPAEFVEEVRRTGTEAGDRLWPMPLTDEYREAIRSDIADITNSAGRDGGAIKAAAFIDAGIEPGTDWAHLDVASTYWSDKDRSHTPKGPQGPGVRTLIALAERFASP